MTAVTVGLSDMMGGEEEASVPDAGKGADEVLEAPRRRWLGRSSIYNTFSSKHELFRRALLHYVEMMTATQLGILEDEGRSPVERLRALFSAVTDGEMASRRDDAWGPKLDRRASSKQQRLGGRGRNPCGPGQESTPRSSKSNSLTT